MIQPNEDYRVLRDCPFCHTKHDPKAESSGPTLQETSIIAIDGTFSSFYTVKCFECGAEVSGEYINETVSLWNGNTVDNDDEF